MQDEVIEEYSRPFPGEVVETYTRPLPASMAPAKPQAAKKPKRRRWRGFLLLLVIAAGVYGASLALFSFAPPDLPIFTPPV